MTYKARLLKATRKRAAQTPNQFGGMDDEVQAAIELLAETPLTSETPGIHPDHLVDMLIMNARQIMKREGFEIGGET